MNGYRQGFTPLLTVEYGEKDGEPWLYVGLTTEVRLDNMGRTSRPIYEGPAPRLERTVTVIPVPGDAVQS